MNLPRLAAQYGARTNAVCKALILPTGSGLIVRRAAPCRALQQRLSRYRNLATASGGDGDGEPLAALLATRDPVLARDLECSVGLLRTHYRLTASSLLASGALL